MNLTLTSALEALIRARVESGAYDSAAQVVEEALLLLEERDHLRALRRERMLQELASGVFQADNRHLVDGDEVFRGLFDKASEPTE
ncbi:MAG TPA: type II toxin-antitoxin system ParD family antitoxin [Usitatibacter sp.]|nr:type II toxin-antitoxin system ParD family antitoxin [Usitatibacter sp.]